MLNFHLSPKQLEIQQKTREFALREVLPVAWVYDEKDEMPIFRDKDPLEPDTGGTIKPAWRCRMCGHIHHGQNPPEECPYCFFPQNTFKKIWPIAK